MNPAVPQGLSQPMAVLPSAPHWRHIDFISDLHLKWSEPATCAAWQHYLQHTPANALFILGDLFDVWVGDDALHPDPHLHSAYLSPQSQFEVQCAQTLHSASKRLDLHFMPGNRDFLLGAAAAQACGMTLLADPLVLCAGTMRLLLSHGDALCLDDTAYMQVRALVRSPDWQAAFLAHARPQREALGQDYRAQSKSANASAKAGTQTSATTTAYEVDLDTAATCQWLVQAHANTLIHGHTHRPAVHALGRGLQRMVLSDWDAAATPPRAEVLRAYLSQAGNIDEIRRLPLSQAVIPL